MKQIYACKSNSDKGNHKLNDRSSLNVVYAKSLPNKIWHFNKINIVTL